MTETRITFRRGHRDEAAAAVQERICELVIQQKLDPVDLKIIEARDCSPMPTQSEVAAGLGITRQAIGQRLARIESLLSGACAEFATAELANSYQ